MWSRGVHLPIEAWRGWWHGEDGGDGCFHGSHFDFKVSKFG